MRFDWLGILATVVLLTACGGNEADEPPPPPKIRVSGTAYSFTLPGTPYGRIAGGEISLLEAPGEVATADEEGVFSLEGLTGGSEATFVVKAEGFPEGQTKTFTLPGEDLEGLTFQIPGDDLVLMLAAVLGITVADDRCQLVSTITRVGKSIGDEGAHGEPGATVALEPAIPDEHGPVYFNAGVLPDPTLTESSEDGGVLYTNVPPGDYVLTADKEGVEFTPIRLRCRAGVLVNASPPFGLQALSGGIGVEADDGDGTD